MVIHPVFIKLKEQNLERSGGWWLQLLDCSRHPGQYLDPVKYQEETIK